MPAEWRTYKLIKITGWTIQEIDSTPADLCDWVLRLNSVEEQAIAEREAKQRQQERGR